MAEFGTGVLESVSGLKILKLLNNFLMFELIQFVQSLIGVDFLSNQNLKR
jgi:hypothetical protein